MSQLPSAGAAEARNHARRHAGGAGTLPGGPSPADRQSRLRLALCEKAGLGTLPGRLGS
jgi:hypothetical protein